MRLLLGGWSSDVVSLVAVLGILAGPRRAAAQPAGTSAPPPSKSPAVASARAVLQSSSNGEVALDRRMSSRLESAQHLLFDGRYADANAAFAAVLERDSARGSDTLSARAHHGMAIADAFAGHLAQARLHYSAVLRAPVSTAPTLALADSIEAAVLTGQRATATSLLDRFAESHQSVLARQYVQSFRGLSLLLAGNCAGAVTEVLRAPDAGRPLPQAIRGLCASRAGKRHEALTLRDSVLTHPLADPSSWPMVIARGVALKIH
jgi:hypothetical protein